MLINTKNGKRYIGKTSNFKRRCNEHKSRGNKKYKNQLLYVDINKYGFDSFKKIVLHDNLTDKEKNYYEKYYIRFYNTLEKDGMGYNIGNGGEHEDNFYGMNNKRKNEVRKTLSNSSTRKKKVAKYDTDGILIQTYNSCIETQKDVGCRVQSLDSNKPSYIRNWYFLYYEDEPKNKISVTKNKNAKTRILQYDKDMNLVNEYSSYRKAELQGYSKYFIKKVLNKNELYQNYYWKN